MGGLVNSYNRYGIDPISRSAGIEPKGWSSGVTGALGMSKPDAPSPPDYVGAAQAQGAANIETARVQGRIANPNIYSPYGTQNVAWGPNDQPTVTQTLSPESQEAFNAQQRVRMGLSDVAEQGIGSVQGTLGKPFEYSGPMMPINAGMTAQQALMSRLQPQIERERSQQETQLRNQGLVPGGEAYGNAMTIQNQRENDLLNQAALYGVNLDLAANQQAFGQQLTQRNLPLNEVSALMSGSQIQNPQFMGYQGANVAPPNIAGAAQQQAAYNQGLYGLNVGQQNAFNQGLFGLGSAAAMGYFMSDRRLKSNIVRVNIHRLGIGIYEYDLFGQREMGVMADEVMTVMPEAVMRHPTGFLMVDYGRLYGRLYA